MIKGKIVKIALGQFTSVQGEPGRNMQKMLKMIDQAASQNVDLVVFPELAYSGHYCNSFHMQQLAEPQDGFFVQTLCRKAYE